jgi:hypothetical protein
MHWAFVDWEVCRSCGQCVARRVCLTRAIVKPDRDGPAAIDADRCSGCGRCVVACPFEAIRLGTPFCAREIS